jgi:hypothetical protein
MEDLKVFSEVEAEKIMREDPTYKEALEKSSASAEDAKAREKVYSDVMANYENLKEAYKAFSGYAEIPIMSNQYFNASMASYVRSFAGFLTVERSMDQPTSLLWYNDLLGVVDNRVVLPNIGKEDLEGINARFQTSSAFVDGQLEYQISTNKKLIPGSVELRFIHVADPKAAVVVRDDRNGNLIAPAGILAVAQTAPVGINYATGVITFRLGEGFIAAEGDSYTVIGFEDVAGDPAFGQLTGPGNNRFKVDMKNIVLTAEPDMLIGENNLMAIAAAKKAMGMDPQEVTGQKLTELYTKLINQKLARGVINGFTGNAHVIPMDEYSSHFVDFQSRLDAFQADLVNVDTMLAKKTFKATKATCYLVGEGMGNWFRKLASTGNWTDNTESTYINDLLGYYKGIPVLRHIDCGFNDGYACHKVPTGEIAPLMRGIYLPLTNTPLVGNYNNPTQYAQGVYYQEVNSLIFPELIQKFEVVNAANGPFGVRIAE